MLAGEKSKLLTCYWWCDSDRSNCWDKWSENNYFTTRVSFKCCLFRYLLYQFDNGFHKLTINCLPHTPLKLVLAYLSMVVVGRLSWIPTHYGNIFHLFFLQNNSNYYDNLFLALSHSTVILMTLIIYFFLYSTSNNYYYLFLTSSSSTPAVYFICIIIRSKSTPGPSGVTSGTSVVSSPAIDEREHAAVVASSSCTAGAWKRIEKLTWYCAYFIRLKKMLRENMKIVKTRDPLDWRTYLSHKANESIVLSQNTLVV